jgi:hypothetical protein
VAVELKVGKFEPEYAGKMDFYLNLLNEKEASLEFQVGTDAGYSASGRGQGRA